MRPIVKAQQRVHVQATHRVSFQRLESLNEAASVDWADRCVPPQSIPQPRIHLPPAPHYTSVRRPVEVALHCALLVQRFWETFASYDLKAVVDWTVMMHLQEQRLRDPTVQWTGREFTQRRI